MGTDKKFREVSQAVLVEATNRDGKPKPTSNPSIAPDQLTTLQNTLRVHPATPHGKTTAMAALSHSTDQGWISAWNGHNYKRPFEGKAIFCTVTAKPNPQFSSTQYFSSLGKQQDFNSYLRMLKLWPGAGVNLSSPTGAAWWIRPDSEKIALLEQMILEQTGGYSIPGIYDDRPPLKHFTSMLTKPLTLRVAKWNYSIAIRRFPEVLMYHLLREAMHLASVSAITDQTTLKLVYDFAVNRLDENIEDIADRISSPEKVKMFVGGYYMADVPSTIASIQVGPPEVDWLPRAMSAPMALLYAMDQTRWLIRENLRKVGAQYNEVSTPGNLITRHPDMDDSSINPFMVFDPTRSDQEGVPVFRDVSTQRAAMHSPREIVTDPSDPAQAWVPSLKSYDLEESLYRDVRRVLPVEGGTTLSPEEARSLGLDDKEEKTSFVPWAIAGVAAAAIASQVM